MPRLMAEKFKLGHYRPACRVLLRTPGQAPTQTMFQSSNDFRQTGPSAVLSEHVKD